MRAVLFVLFIGCVRRAPANEAEYAQRLWAEFGTEPEAPVFKPNTGRISPLDEAPAASGFFMLRRLKCTLASAEAIARDDDQAAIYPGRFESYTRATSGDTWLATLSANANGTVYSAEMAGRIARFEHAFTVKQEFTHPATGGHFPREHQLEAFFDDGEDGLLHFYAVWREVSISGYDVSNDFVLSLVLGKMSGFDDQAERRCQDIE